MFRICVFVLAATALAAPARAQDFGVVESAETISRGNVKLGGYPLFIFPEGEDDVEPAGAVTLGIGLSDAVDVELRGAFADDINFVGADVEVWFLKSALDLSARGGFHYGFVDGDIGDRPGLDLSVIGSGAVAPRLDLYAAIDVSVDWVDVGLDERDRRTTVHLVPGIEVKLAETLDLLGEFGIAVNDDAQHYVAVGIAYYFR